MDAFDDFDFGESSRPTISLPTTPQEDESTPSVFDFARPSFGTNEPSDSTIDDGSSMFGRLSIGSSAPGSPATEDQTPLPLIDTAIAGSSSEAADLATDEAEPMGPSMHPNAHVTEDGFVEAQVEGKTIRVPADDVSFRLFHIYVARPGPSLMLHHGYVQIILAHRRSRSRSSSTSSDTIPINEHRPAPQKLQPESAESDHPASPEAESDLAGGLESPQGEP